MSSQPSHSTTHASDQRLAATGVRHRLWRRTRNLVLALVLLTGFIVLQPAASARAYAPGTNVVVQSGGTTIRSSYTLDIDTGQQAVAGTDIWWEAFTSTTRAMQPTAGAQIRNLGTGVSYDALTGPGIAALGMGTTGINGSNVGNQLVVGDVFVVRSATGNVAKFKVLRWGQDITVAYVTYLKPLAAPVIVNPANGVLLQHYPRVTTINWTRVAGATYYVVERQYSSGAWVSYPAVRVSGYYNTSYSFSFVGDQPGRARVTAFNASNLSGSSAWVGWNYRTGIRLATPAQTSPVNGVVLHNYPRTTTVTWNPVPGAASYRVEVQYYDTQWRAWQTRTVTGVLNADCTFAFVGKQPGRWRVTAMGASGDYFASAPSAWRTFTYTV